MEHTENGTKYLEFNSKNMAGLTTLKLVEKPSNALGPDEVLLFSDGKTYVGFKAQDEYDYHDCLSSARSVDLRCDAEEWKKFSNWAEVKKYG